MSGITGASVDDCDGKEIAVELIGAGGTLGTGESNVSATTSSDPPESATLCPLATTGQDGCTNDGDILAADVTSVSVTIAGALSQDGSSVTIP